MFYLPDRVTGNILRVDPKSPKAVVVGRIEAREIEGKRVNADPSRIAFDSQGIFLKRPVVPRSCAHQVLSSTRRSRGWRDLCEGTAGANGIAFDRQGNLFVSGAASGIAYRVGPNGGGAEAAVQIDKYVRTLPDGKTQSRSSPTVSLSMPTARSHRRHGARRDLEGCDRPRWQRRQTGATVRVRCSNAPTVWLSIAVARLASPK